MQRIIFLIAITLSVAIGQHGNAQQVIYSQPAYSQPVDYSSPVYSQSQPYVMPSYPPAYSHSGYGTISNPNSTYTISNSNYSSPVYSTNANGTFATYPSATAVSNYVPSYTTTAATSSGLAQQKAQQMAQMNMRGHPGGGLGGARYEGVGWSTISAQSAISSCCYWGQRTPMQVGVSRGSDGCWYACVLYQ